MSEGRGGIVERISCDECGYLDVPTKFPDIDSEKGKELLKKYQGSDYDPLNVGVICPECGNCREFDFDPFYEPHLEGQIREYNRLKEILEEKCPEVLIQLQ